jgi:hypothetical protein
LILTFIASLIIPAFPSWRTVVDDDGSEMEVKPFPSVTNSGIALAVATFSSLLAFAAMVSQEVAAAATARNIQNMAYGSVLAKKGESAMVLGWLAFVWIAILSLGLVAQIVSLRNWASMVEDSASEE